MEQYQEIVPIIDRKRRGIYVVKNPITKKKVVVKRYADHTKAERELYVMQMYGENPRLVRLIDFYVKDGQGHIVMERLKGKTLTKLVGDRGAFPRKKVIAIALQILLGVDALHSLDMIHGDLHGGNVIVTSYKDAKIKIIDFQHTAYMNRFGMAHAVKVRKNPPARLAPETQSGIIDPSYDIYSVGYMCAMMMLGGRRKVLQRIKKSRSGKDPLWKVIHKATRTDPQRRYRSVKAMTQALVKAGRR